MTEQKAERFISIGTSSGETTIDLQRVVMIRLDGDSVVLTLDVGPTITAHAADHIGDVYRQLVGAWKSWLTR